MIASIAMFTGLLAGHALADGPLQQGWVGRLKGSPHLGRRAVGYAVHGTTHAGLVLMLTGSLALFAAELVAHVTIDAIKKTGAYGNVVDQILHVACKVLWVWIWSAGLGV